jgi:predicted glycosyltransferase
MENMTSLELKETHDSTAVSKTAVATIELHSASGRNGAQKQSGRGKRIWIDIDNSPHVPFFLPIIDELRKRDYELLLTARDMYQVCQLLDFYKLPCRVIGGHWGKNKALKVLSNCVRAAKLMPVAANYRPDLGISHGSRAQVLVGKALGFRTLMMHDYEHSTKTGFLESDWTLMPDVIPNETMSKHAARTKKYPGLKEDVYVPRFQPDASIFAQLGISPENLVITLRPPATEAHYHNPEAEILFEAAVNRIAKNPNARAVTLPRNARQEKQLRERWADLLARRQMIIPGSAVDGLNLIWFSDLVISGGGTMNREAAALGVPVYSVFRGKIGAVDQYLSDTNRMTLLESVDDVEKKLKLERWARPALAGNGDRPALQSILETIQLILESR